jgi:predicted ATPase
MKIEYIKIENFKSIESIEILEPNCFSVFVGANASGKSNLVDSIEFGYFLYRFGKEAINLFGDIKDIINFNTGKNEYLFEISNYMEKLPVKFNYFDNELSSLLTPQTPIKSIDKELEKFSRIFIGKKNVNKIQIKDSSKLNTDCENMVKVLSRLFENEIIKKEIEDWLKLFIPGFSNIEIIRDNLTGNEDYLIYENTCSQPLKSSLVSDGTKNILSLLTAVFQSDEPQFLLIEEPENGLNPKVLKELIRFIRELCEEKKHYIWLMTHSQTIVSELKMDELIVINKKKGKTVIRQFHDFNLHGLKIDEAWLSNVFDGGIPW